ncbi:MAG: zinc-binding dehydrogenase [Gammaproteobacteria bacterium AqS3]|nr:zinc-binding dehydrogenase [Gammaproteobacteria bacterium AqS3]
MKAAIARNGTIHVEDIPPPEPGSGQVLVRTRHCGICGSDLHALTHGAAMMEEPLSPLMAPTDFSSGVVMGHEFCAEIVDFGPDTERALKPGALVCSMPMALHNGQVHTVGYSNELPGGYAEFMVLNEMLLLPVPSGLDARTAALTEPMAVGTHAVERANLGGGEVLLVIGCGPVGLAVISALKVRECGPVVAADFSPLRRQMAERCGADVVVDPAEASPYQTWVELSQPAGYDPAALENLFAGENSPLRPTVAFECVGVPGVLATMMQACPRDSRIVVVGVCMEEDRIRPLQAIARELNLQFVLGYSPEEFAATLAQIESGALDIGHWITGEVGIDGIAGAFAELASPNAHAKILVTPS